jgi:D-beta-D-heptose 7-phosphate kinase/D-beta-D-heptose 1-phosphate adenosyltransferase
LNRISRKTLKKLVGKFKNKKVLVVGDLMIDEYIWGKVSRISPEAPIPVVEVQKEDSKPGGAANVILNLVSLGAKVFAAGVTGRDDNAKRLNAYLKKVKVNTSAVVADKTRPTTVKTRVIAHHQQVVRIDKEHKADISAATARNIIRKVSKIIKKIDAIIFSDYDKGLLTGCLVDGIMNMSKGMIVTVDPKPGNVGIFRDVTLISPNKKEASEAAGIQITNEEDVLSASKILKDITNSQAILITRGEEGMSLYEDGRIRSVPTVAREVFDVTGAGDTVISVVTLALASGSTFDEAAVLSNIAAGVVVAEVGVVTLNPKELEAAVDERH